MLLAISILTTAILFGSLPLYGTDSATVSYRASESELMPGDSFTVTASLDSAADIKSIRINAVYDDTVFELVSAQWLLTGAAIAYADSMPALAAFSKNTTAQGDIFSCSFRVKDDAAAGNAEISLDVAIKTKPDGVETELPCTVQNGITLRIGPFSDVLYGDINGDGTVDVKDLTRLMKYFAGENVTVTESDLTGDGKSNAKDLARLMKIISST